ncbi:MAG: Gfo/Idh/MocA family oxidoreductase [Thermoguttaceae bacterium]|jgi:predicted dehydrogenase|nr:Gfo/Idh/MocA family oxidoreductase [Thermoguttaceae bacterium]
MPRHDRRTFLAAAVGAAATVTIAGTKSTGSVFGANDAICVGVAGIRGRGGDHIGEFLKIPGVRVTHLIDPDRRLFAGRIKQIQGQGGGAPKCFQDIRKALEDKDLDAVSVATCNHWHSLVTIWACQAGKDVYVEKPCSHNVFEGRQCVEAARRCQRIVQHGTQRRSGNGWQLARDIAAGKFGRLLVARGRSYRVRNSIGHKPPKDPPPELDYNLWLGPAPMQPYHENLVHYNWHWFWDTGNGDIGNNGVHAMDATRWQIPNATLPNAVISVGGRFLWNDQGQTPNLQFAVFDFGPTKMIFEVTEFKTEGGRDDRVFDSKGKVEPITVTSPADVKNPTAPRGPGSNIFENFIACVRSRRSQDLDAHILEGHYSSALCHLANISYRLGHDAPLAKKPPELGDHEEVDKTFAWFREMLVGLGVDLKKATFRVGRPLKFDPKTEKFLGDAEADKLLTREYRAPFVVPREV